MAKSRTPRKPKTAPEANAKQAEVVLRESQESFRALVEFAPVAIVVIDADGRILLVNVKTEELFGYGRDELVSQPMEILLPALLRNGHAGHVADYFSAPRVRAMGELLNLVGQRKDGSEFPIDCALSFVELEGGVLGMAFATDITERKRVEQALRASVERDARLAETLGAAVFILHGTDLAYVNPAGQKMTGYSFDELRSMRFTEILPPEDREQVTQWIVSGEREGRSPSPYRHRLLTKDGEVRWVEVSATGTFFDGRPAVVEFALDITDRRRTEEALRESAERYRDLYEEAPVAYFSVGVDGRVRSANRAAVELLGCALDDLLGRPVFDLYADTPEGKAKAKKLFRRFRAGREIRGEELTMRRADGTDASISLSVRPIRDAQGQVVATRSMAVDITEQKQMEEALQRAREELEGKVERQMVRRNPYGLTFREFTVLHLVAAGRADKEIASELSISPFTVSKHVANILAKMDAASRTEAGVRAFREGLLD